MWKKEGQNYNLYDAQGKHIGQVWRGEEWKSSTTGARWLYQFLRAKRWSTVYYADSAAKAKMFCERKLPLAK